MLTSNPVSVKVPVVSGNFTMVAKGQKHRVSLEVWGEGQITTFRVTCQQTGKEWWFDAFNGKLWRGFDPDKKIPKCELPEIEFIAPARSSVPSIPCYPDWIECAGRPYLFPSNEPDPNDDFIYEDTEPSDLARYNEPMSDPMTWQEF